MTANEIQTENPYVKLVAPKLEYASLSLKWVSGTEGLKLLTKMGNNLPADWVPSLKEEQERIKNFIESDDEINWQIQYKDKIIGAVWLDLKPAHQLGPHIMIGDPSVEGKGVATASLRAVIQWAFEEKTGKFSKFNYQSLTTRCKTDNLAIIHINQKLGFTPIGSVYFEDSFEWQNYGLSLKRFSNE